MSNSKVHEDLRPMENEGIWEPLYSVLRESEE